MPFRGPGDVVFEREPPEFDYCDGLFHIRYTKGSHRIERVMLPSVFMRMLRGAAECARKHRFAGAEIIDFITERDKAKAG
jgi:hypothetical protein